jgi:hypothetical protein
VQGDDDRGEDEGCAESFAPAELLAEEHDPGQHGDGGVDVGVGGDCGFYLPRSAAIGTTPEPSCDL